MSNHAHLRIFKEQDILGKFQLKWEICTLKEMHTNTKSAPTQREKAEKNENEMGESLLLNAKYLSIYKLSLFIKVLIKNFMEELSKLLSV